MRFGLLSLSSSFCVVALRNGVMTVSACGLFCFVVCGFILYTSCVYFSFDRFAVCIGFGKGRLFERFERFE